MGCEVCIDLFSKHIVVESSILLCYKNLIVEIEPKESSVRNVNFNLFNCLTHTFYSKHILNNCDLY